MSVRPATREARSILQYGYFRKSETSIWANCRTCHGRVSTEVPAWFSEAKQVDELEAVLAAHIEDCQ